MNKETKEEIVEDLSNTSISVAGGMVGKFIDSFTGNAGIFCELGQNVGDIPEIYKFVKNKIKNIKNKKKQNGEMNDKNEG